MTKLKKTALAFGTVCALAFTGGLATLNAFPASAAEARAAGDRGYYGKLLSNDIAGAFYDELVEMTLESGGLSEFRKGESHPVDAQAILDEAANYAGGNMNLAKQFGAALDSFRYDYDDLFYLDYDRINFTVTKKTPEEPPQTEEGGETVQADEETPSADVTYEVTIGAGRATSYFLYGLTPTDLNGEDGKSGMFAQYTAAQTTLMNDINAEFTKASATSVKDKAVTVSQYLTKKFGYGFDYTLDGEVNSVDRFVNTTNSIVKASSNADYFASSEGLARVYKMVMDKLHISCELVSGYTLVQGRVTRGMWNYVQDESDDWYAVDVAGNKANSNKYLFLSGELFYLDHYEDGIVSLSNYKLNYPDLVVNNYNVETGVIEIADGSYEGREGIAVAYKGTDGKLAFRTKDENGVWSGWTTFEAFMLTDGPDAEKENENTPAAQAEDGEETNPDQGTDGEGAGGNTGESTGGNESGGGDTTPTEPTDPGTTEPEPTEPEPTEPTAPTYNIAEKDGVYYLFNLTKGSFQIGILNADDKCVEYSDTVRDALGKVVPIALEANDTRLRAQNISQELSVEITYPEALNKIDENAEVTVDFTVSSPLGNPFEDEFVKQYCSVKDVVWNPSTRALTFKFTPSNLLEHNGLCYSFTPENLQSASGALPQSYAVVFKFGEIKAGGVFAGSNLYTDIVTQPTLAFNNDLSLEGWTYNGSSKVTDNMRSTLALSVSKPAATTDALITEAVKNAVSNSGSYFANAYAANENYLLDLTLDGKNVRMPDTSYAKLAFPYPAGHGPEDMSVVYKVVQFKKNANGETDYEHPEILDVVALRQGLVVAVNSFSTFSLVTLSTIKLNYTGNQYMRAVMTETTGVGGTVKADTNKPVNAIMSTSADDAVVFTITADIGYKLDSLMVNGVKRTDFTTTTEGNSETSAVYTYRLLYVPLVLNSNGQNTTSPYNVIRFEFAPADATEADTEVSNAVAEVYMKAQLNREPYSDTEKNSIIRDYPTGGAVYVPVNPPKDDEFDPKSTMMQLIIVLSVLGAFAVIGAIVIIYCGAIRPKIVREREEEAARIAANRERRANRNRIQPMNNLPPRDPQNPMRK